MIRTVIAAVDGSEPSTRAVRMAADIAAKYDAELLLVHVLHWRRVPEPLRRLAEIEHLVEPETRRNVPLTYIELPPEPTEDMRILAALGEFWLNEAELTARGQGAVKVKKVPVEGRPAEALIREAERRGADLLACGTRGHGELAALLLGSVAHELLQLAPCPVLAVK